MRGIALARDLGREHLIRAALHDPFVVVFRIRAPRRKLEAAAALDAAVATGAIASLSREDSADIAARIRIRGLRKSLLSESGNVLIYFRYSP